MHYYIGTMSGTSIDGIDVVIVKFENNTRPSVVFATCSPYPRELKDNISKAITSPQSLSIESIGTLNTALGHAYANAINTALNEAQVGAEEIFAIGNHGQTLYHQPQSELPFSMQIGDASIIAEITGITTVCDFRSRDLAAGGQGAPLVPAFHKACFSSPNSNRVIVNIGGIANLTFLNSENKNDLPEIIGFDTGPGNTLIDLVCQHFLDEPRDEGGKHASKGIVNDALLRELQSHPYFEQAIPKSTGREVFNLDLLTNFLNEQEEVSTHDVLATLIELTAWSIVKGINDYCENVDEIYICGGGSHNDFLIERLSALIKSPIHSTEKIGLAPDWVEATAFAWLAKQTLENLPGNAPSVTGAKGERILGAIYPK